MRKQSVDMQFEFDDDVGSRSRNGSIVDEQNNNNHSHSHNNPAGAAGGAWGNARGGKNHQQTAKIGGGGGAQGAMGIPAAREKPKDSNNDNKTNGGILGSAPKPFSSSSSSSAWGGGGGGGILGHGANSLCANAPTFKPATSGGGPVWGSGGGRGGGGGFGNITSTTTTTTPSSSSSLGVGGNDFPGLSSSKQKTESKPLASVVNAPSFSWKKVLMTNTESESSSVAAVMTVSGSAVPIAVNSSSSASASAPHEHHDHHLSFVPVGGAKSGNNKKKNKGGAAAAIPVPTAGGAFPTPTASSSASILATSPAVSLMLANVRAAVAAKDGGEIDASVVATVGDTSAVVPKVDPTGTKFEEEDDKNEEDETDDIVPEAITSQADVLVVEDAKEEESAAIAGFRKPNEFDDENRHSGASSRHHPDSGRRNSSDIFGMSPHQHIGVDLAAAALSPSRGGGGRSSSGNNNNAINGTLYFSVVQEGSSGASSTAAISIGSGRSSQRANLLSSCEGENHQFINDDGNNNNNNPVEIAVEINNNNNNLDSTNRTPSVERVFSPDTDIMGALSPDGAFSPTPVPAAAPPPAAATADEKPAEEKEEENNNNEAAATTGHKKVCLGDFERTHLIGEGGFGKVFLVRRKDNPQTVYALKSMRKDIILQSNVEGTKAERRILAKVEHPFIVRLHYAFQTDQRLFLVMDYISGGQILLHLEKQGAFNEDAVRFYSLEIALALHELHSRNIVHRDLKPENILLGKDGHVIITDFGCSKDFVSPELSRTNSFVGTDMYMAPEQINGSSYSFPVDWWALGVLTWEMLTGSNPFEAATKQATIKKVMTRKLVLPSYYSGTTHSLLKGLLERDPEKRLGSKGSKQVLKHKFFNGIDQRAMLRKEVAPPFLPCRQNAKAADLSNVRGKYLSQPLSESPIDSSPLTMEDQLLFRGFTYERDSPMIAKIKEDIDTMEEQGRQREQAKEEEEVLNAEIERVVSEQQQQQQQQQQVVEQGEKEGGGKGKEEEEEEEEEHIHDVTPDVAEASWVEEKMINQLGKPHPTRPDRVKPAQFEFPLDSASVARAQVTAGPSLLSNDASLKAAEIKKVNKDKASSKPSDKDKNKKKYRGGGGGGGWAG